MVAAAPTTSLQSRKKKGLREGEEETLPDSPLQTFVYDSLARTLQIATWLLGVREGEFLAVHIAPLQTESEEVEVKRGAGTNRVLL